MGRLREIPQERKGLQKSKNTSFYSNFGRNHPIVSIDGYDGTVHRGPFRLSRGRQILMNGPDVPRG